MGLDHPVLSSLLPVVLLIAVGWVAGRAGLMRRGSVRELSNVVFMVFSSALLFRTMSQVDVLHLDLRPVLLYFAVAIVLFVGLLRAYGGGPGGAVLGLAGMYSNAVMIGIPLVGLAYGQEGQVLLFTLISLHALVLLSMVTVVLELQVARERAQASGEPAKLWRTLAQAVRSALLHPVPVPILLGLLWGLTGWGLHPVLDLPLKLLGQAFGPLALLMVGLSLAHTDLMHHWQRGLRLSLVKNALHPLLMLGAGWLFGLRGLSLAVMVMAAALPIGANVFMFSQRYRRHEDLVTAGVAVSTLGAMLSVTLVMTLLPLLPAA